MVERWILNDLLDIKRGSLGIEFEDFGQRATADSSFSVARVVEYEYVNVAVVTESKSDTVFSSSNTTVTATKPISSGILLLPKAHIETNSSRLVWHRCDIPPV